MNISFCPRFISTSNYAVIPHTLMGSGIGWLGCNCHDGLIGGALLGGGATAVWEALKNDRPAHNTFNNARDKVTK